MKNKELIRILSCTLALASAVTLLAACKSSNTEEENPYQLVEGGLDGYTLNVLSTGHFYTDTPEDLMYTEEANGDTMRETVYARNARVEKKYGLEVKQTYTGYDESMIDYVVKMTAAQDDAYQMCTTYLPSLTPYIEQNLFYNALDIPYINYDAEYWDGEIMESLAINGYLMGLGGTMFPGTNEGMVVTMYNTPLAADFAIDNLYDVVNEGKWTFDRRIEEMEKVKTDLDNDGHYSFSDRIGMLYASNNCMPYMKASGIQFVYKDNSGEFVFDKSVSEKAELTVEKVAKMIKTKGYAIDWLIAVDGINTIINMIENKQVLFQDIILSIVRRFYREIKSDFGILPLPKLSEEQEYYYNNGNIPCMSIPVSNPDIEKTGFALEALASESTDFPNIYFHVCLESKFTRDAESIDMIMIAYDHCITDPLTVYGFGGFGTEINDMLLNGRSYISALANYEDAIETDISALMSTVG